MGSIFKVLAQPELPIYTPDPIKVWNKIYWLHGAYATAEQIDFDLQWARNIYDLTEEYDDHVTLRLDRGRGVMELRFGRHSSIAQADLAPLDSLTRICHIRHDYTDKDHAAAEDEPAIRVHVRLEAGEHFLEFADGQPARYASANAWASPKFSEQLRALAEETGTPYEDVRSEDPPPPGW